MRSWYLSLFNTTEKLAVLFTMIYFKYIEFFFFIKTYFYDQSDIDNLIHNASAILSLFLQYTSFYLLWWKKFITNKTYYDCSISMLYKVAQLFFRTLIYALAWLMEAAKVVQSIAFFKSMFSIFFLHGMHRY